MAVAMATAEELRKAVGTDGISDDEDFEDALDKVAIANDMSLKQSIEDVAVTLKLFLNNHFAEAKARMEPWADRSHYHALGYSTIMFIQAIMTVEAQDIDAAINSLKQSLRVCSRYRKKSTLVQTISKLAVNPNYDSYTEDELHAELAVAETLLQRALLTFIQDENLISFVKGSLKVRQCYNCYKECQKILEKRHWKDSDFKQHFQSGVRMGMGTFNLMISLLPTKIMRLLEFVGFSGNKVQGLKDLEDASMDLVSLRGPLCAISLIGYHTVVTFILGMSDGDIDKAESLLKPCLALYPKGALFLFFAGRIEEVKGNIDQAITRFEESISSQSEWKQFHHLCYWELMWCHSFQRDWLLAMKYAERLSKESKWSRATYTYQKACFLLMCPEQSDDTSTHLGLLFKEIPKLKQRLAGKSLPMEKFAMKKAKRYESQDGKLVLAAYELIYVWNGFPIIGKKMKMIQAVLEDIETTLQDLVQNKASWPFYADNYGLVLLLKGVALRYRDQAMQAEQCLLEVAEMSSQFEEDLYLSPYAYVELALLSLSVADYKKAQGFLDKARTFKGYSLESRLHFRIHAAHSQMAGKEQNTHM